MEADSGSLGRRLNFNTVVALGCILLGIAIWFLIPYQVQKPPTFLGQNSSGLSPALFPRLAAAGFVVVGLAYLVLSFRMYERSTLRELPASAYVNLAVLLAVMIVYVALLRPLGYVLSSMLVATGIALYYGSRNAFGIAAVGVAAPLAIYFLFTRMLTVSLPPFPWG